MLPVTRLLARQRQDLPAPMPRRAAAGRSLAAPVRRAGRDLLFGPPVGLFVVGRAMIERPAWLLALSVLLVCVPGGDRDMSASAHVTPADLASVALVLAVVPRVFAGPPLPRTRLWWAMAATVIGLGLATVTSHDPALSASGFVRYLQLFVIVPTAVVLAVRDRRDLRLVCGAVLAVAVMQGTVGTWQYLTGTGASFAGGNVRAVGTFGALDVMGMSTVVAYGIVVALGLGLAHRGRARLGLLALAALLVVPMLLSLSRGGVVATIGAIAVMLLATSPRLALRTALFGGAAALVVLGPLGAAGTPIGERLGTIATSVTSPDRSVSDRYALWETAIAISRDHPMTGVGLKEFRAYRDAYAPLHLSSGSDVADPSLGFRREELLSPHNMYLLVLSEQGLLGALAFGALLLGLAVATWRRTRQLAGALDHPDRRLSDGRLIGGLAVGTLTWTLINFFFSDIGGPSTVLMSVLIGVALWWAVQPEAGRWRVAAE
jgi:O-antigen ligase